MKKNIILFVNSFWNNGKGMSGGDQMLIQIFKRIRNEFGKVICYTNQDGKKVIEQHVSNIEYKISSKFFDKLNLLINYFFRCICAFKVIFTKNVDIIYGSSDFFPDVLPCFFYKLLHPKTKWVQCVFHIYPDWRTRPGSKAKSFVAQYLQKFSLLFIKKSDTIININTQVRDELIKLGFDKTKIIINPPGIDIDYFINLNSKSSKIYQGSFLARLNPSKGIFDLIKIWRLVVDQIPQATLAIMGGGSKEIIKQLTEEIKNNKLESNIDILGFLENDDAFGIIKNSKVFVFPSHEEGFGIVIAESMLCKTPVISWNLPVFDEIFEDNIIKIQENNINEMAQSIIKIIQDQSYASNIINNGFEFVKKYSWESISNKHLKILIK